MLIIADKKIPEEAKNNLRKYGKLVLLETCGITEESISGHPDIFFCKTPDNLIVSPNLPDYFKKILIQENVSFKEGKTSVASKYPNAACYNAVVTQNYLIHRADITDDEIIKNCCRLQQINVRQGFTRCSILPLKENRFITSDGGIFKTLVKSGFQTLFVSAKGIVLPGHPNGFFGGACGINENKIFIIGNLNHFDDGQKVKLFLKPLDYEIIELCDEHLFDGGSIVFLN